jgi:tetratricopeptide (TPR) repeat protein
MKQYEVNPKDAALLSYIAQYHAMLGEREVGLAWIKRALRLDPRSADVSLSAAIVYNQVGDISSTLLMLERALKGGLSVATVLNTPNFSNLGSQPGFRELLRTAHSGTRAGPR